MAHTGGFLELLQLVDAGRKVVGRSSHEIRDEDVARALEIDQAESSHNTTEHASDHENHLCPGCQAIRQDRAMFREKLRSQSQDLPPDLLS